MIEPILRGKQYENTFFVNVRLISFFYGIVQSLGNQRKNGFGALERKTKRGFNRGKGVE
jgi:hypothetical protein